MTDPLDIDRSRAAWWVLGAGLAAAVAYVVYSFVGTFVFAVFIYYATRPVYRQVRRRLDHPNLAAAASLLLLMLPVLLLLWYAIAIGLQELDRFATRAAVENYGQVLQPYVNVSRVASDPASLLADSGGLEALQATFAGAMRYVGFLGTGALHLFVMFAMAFYLLRDDARLSRWFHARFDDDRGVVEAYLHDVDRDFNNIFFGNILNAILTATIGALAYSVLDLFAPDPVSIPYAALVGLLAGVASLVPVVGMKLVYFPVAAYLGARAALSSPSELLWFPVVFFVVSFVVVDAIPDLVLRPYVSGRSLHVGMVMFAYIFGPLLFGWPGIFLAPMLLVLVVHFVRIVLPELLAGEPIRPYAVDPTYLAESGDRTAVGPALSGPTGGDDADRDDADAGEGNAVAADAGEDDDGDHAGRPPGASAGDAARDATPDGTDG